MLSGTISLFYSKCFSPFPHGTGSLSVSREYLALPDGPGRFTQNSSCSALLRIPIRSVWLRLRGCHPLRPNFPERSPHHTSPTTRSYNPTHAVTSVVWALPRSLATTRGIIHLFSLPPATKMFQFAGLASIRMHGFRVFNAEGCPIRISAGQRSFAPRRSFSQLITSFIASESQGIRHAPLSYFPRARVYDPTAFLRTGIYHSHSFS